MSPSIDLGLESRDSYGISSSPIGTRIVNPLRETRWDAIILSHPNYSFFHGASWAEVLHATYDYTPCYFAEYGPGRPLELFPVIEVDSSLTGRRGISLPFTDECHPLVSNGPRHQRMLQKVMDYGKSRRWKYLEYRGGKPRSESEPRSISFYGHSLSISGDETHLFAGFKSETRTAVRKAERAGLQVEISQRLETLRTFYNLHCLTRKKHGLPPQPFPFFENIYRYILSRDMGFIVTACLGGKEVAAALFVYLGKKIIYKFAASDSAFQTLRGSNLVIWHAIKWAVHNGFEVLSFGRTSLWNQGLRRFKLAWGTEESQLDYFKYDFRAGRFVREKDMTAGWHTKVFQILPVRLLRIIGAVLYRQIA